MVRPWRLTRNRYGRAVYDALARRGVTATLMCEYVRELDGRDARGPADDAAFAVETCAPRRVAELGAPVDELVPGEEVVAAFERGRPLGYLFLSVDAAHEIAPLERTLSFDGAYVRRVFVDPDHRNRGVATATVAAARRRAAERGATRVTALVAVDNAPSRALFERQGFEARRVHRYARVGPLSHRSVRPA